MEEEGEAHRSLAIVGEYHFSGGIVAKQCAPDVIFGGDAQLSHPLVFGETVDE